MSTTASWLTVVLLVPAALGIAAFVKMLVLTLDRLFVDRGPWWLGGSLTWMSEPCPVCIGRSEEPCHRCQDLGTVAR